MKKLIPWLIIGLFLSVGSMVGIHWIELRDVKARLGRVQELSERQAIVADLVLSLEQYRRASGNFRKLSNEEVAAAKTRIRTEMNQGLGRLERMHPSDEEAALNSAIHDQFGELMMLAAKLEPQLYTRDVYQKEAIRDLHENIIGNLKDIARIADRHQAGIRPQFESSASRSMRLLGAAGGVVVVIFLLMLIREHFAYSRPIRKLLDRAQLLSKSLSNTQQGAAQASSSPAKGKFQSIEETMNRFSTTLDAFRKERHQFISAVANDIRVPLVSLRTGAEMLISDEQQVDAEQKEQAMDMVKSSVYRLARHMEDLNDLVEVDRASIQLDEKVVDLGKLLENLGSTMGGARSAHPIRVIVPQMPVWTFIDPERMERVLIHLVNKLSLQSPQGAPIQVTINRLSQSSFRGLEVLVHEASESGALYPTGPAQNVLNHWISENGFGMALAQRIVTAHGGTLTASGVMGTGVQFSLRIPEERIATGMNGAASTISVASSGLLEHPWIKTVFPKHAVNFGS